MATFYASYPLSGNGGTPFTPGNLTDVGTDGIVITNGTNAVNGAGTQIAQHVADTTHNGYLSSTDWNTFNNKQSALTFGNLTDAGTDGITVTGGTGAVIGSGTSLSQHVADSTHNGYLSSTDWTTFNNKQSALTLGDLTDAGTDGIVVTGGTGAVVGSGTSIAQHVADTTHNGYLSSTDWNTFNGKQAAGNYITALTGDVTASGPGSVAATLATVNSNVGSFGDATHVGAFTVNGKGLITAAASTSIQIAESQVTNLVTDLAAKQSTTLTSAHILVGNGSNVATDVAMTGDIAITNGGVTSYSGTVPLNKGGTGQTTKAPAFDALSPMTTAGDLILGGASGTGTRLGIGSNTFVLTSNGTTASWAANAAAATATATTTGLTTSYFPVIQSAVKSVSSANYTILDNDGYEIIAVTTGASDRTITMPSAANNIGRSLKIKKVDSGAGKVLITRAGSDTMDGETTVELSDQYEEATLYGVTSSAYSITAAVFMDTAIASGTGTASGDGVIANLTSAVLSKGTWDVTASAHGNGGDGNQIRILLSTTSASAAGTTEGTTDVGVFTNGTNRMTAIIPMQRIAVTTDTTYYVNAATLNNSGTDTCTGYVYGKKVSFKST